MKKTIIYELIGKQMVGRSVQVFTRFNKNDIIHIRSHMFENRVN